MGLVSSTVVVSDAASPTMAADDTVKQDLVIHGLTDHPCPVAAPLTWLYVASCKLDWTSGWKSRPGRHRSAG